MRDSLNASGYPFAEDDYRGEFERILSKIVACYNTMVANNVQLANYENRIRDYMLYNYLKNQSFKELHKLTDYLFDPELPESTGRIDIRVIPVNPLINDEAFYVIECKRINSNNATERTGLNAKYISEGMCRFISKKYSSYFGASGMIGFVIQSLNIGQNIGSINQLLKTTFKQETNTVRELEYRSLVPGFDFSYWSTHNVDQGSIVLYHLMLDFSRLISSN